MSSCVGSSELGYVHCCKEFKNWQIVPHRSGRKNNLRKSFEIRWVGPRTSSGIIIRPIKLTLIIYVQRLVNMIIYAFNKVSCKWKTFFWFHFWYWTKLDRKIIQPYVGIGIRTQNISYWWHSVVTNNMAPYRCSIQDRVLMFAQSEASLDFFILGCILLLLLTHYPKNTYNRQSPSYNNCPVFKMTKAKIYNTWVKKIYISWGDFPVVTRACADLQFIFWAHDPCSRKH